MVRLGRQFGKHGPQVRVDNARPEGAHFKHVHVLVVVTLRLVVVVVGTVELGGVEVWRERTEILWKIARVVVLQTESELQRDQHCVATPQMFATQRRVVVARARCHELAGNGRVDANRGDGTRAPRSGGLGGGVGVEVLVVIAG